MDRSGNRHLCSANAPPEGASSLRLQTEHLPCAVVLTVGGDIDLSGIGALSTALAEAILQESPLLVVDLTPARFLSCGGISVLVAAHHLTSDETRLVVVASSRATWRPLRLTGVDRLLSVHDDLQDALR
ncbi:STAS domain-containing protein [Amycolatopsis sp. WQ 127309]|uniref:STAS domain-containing protein n=1 Tax=Amycolatopsis sp. WQ 127309 TaxID=2932773 RepID=UPI001FF34835|nr:STAS domain-containing protein [Amycolatopsis sp. WQ 127309]UOZ04893.1 STAS domain-containing protein [Amycolatopsis sp. WQ 127309]